MGLPYGREKRLYIKDKQNSIDLGKVVMLSLLQITCFKFALH